jgi:hypothetical protein
MPPHIIRKLNFIDGNPLRFNALSNYVYWRYRANSVFDPDPLILTGGISGFTELAALYREYRVTHLEFEWNISNRESFPVMIGLAFTTLDVVGTITSGAAAFNLLENGYSTRGKILSAAGGQDRFTFKGKVSIADLFGNPEQYAGDNSYAANVTGDPARLLFANCVAVSTTGANMALGVSISMTLRYTTQFFNRQSNQL